MKELNFLDFCFSINLKAVSQLSYSRDLNAVASLALNQFQIFNKADYFQLTLVIQPTFKILLQVAFLFCYEKCSKQLNWITQKQKMGFKLSGFFANKASIFFSVQTALTVTLLSDCLISLSITGQKFCLFRVGYVISNFLLIE